MKRRRVETNQDQKDKFVKHVVVEAFDCCQCHRAVTTYMERADGDDHFHFLFVRKPTCIDFNDILLEEKVTGIWYLARGPLLKFNIQVDEFPKKLLARLVFERASDMTGFQPRF